MLLLFHLLFTAQQLIPFDVELIISDSLTNMHIQYNGQTYTTGRLLYVTAGSSITCTVSAYPAACLGWEKVTGSGPTIPQVRGDGGSTCSTEAMLFDYK